MEYVLDASIIIKWFLIEFGSERALAYRGNALRGAAILHGTELLFFEVSNVLATKPIPLLDVKAALDDLYASSLCLHSFDYRLAQKTADLSSRVHVSSYDASYIALAQQLGCPFVTADEKLFYAMKQAEIPVVMELFR